MNGRFEKQGNLPEKTVMNYNGVGFEQFHCPQTSAVLVQRTEELLRDAKLR